MRQGHVYRPFQMYSCCQVHFKYDFLPNVEVLLVFTNNQIQRMDYDNKLVIQHFPEFLCGRLKRSKLVGKKILT